MEEAFRLNTKMNRYQKVPILFYSGVAGNEEQHKAMNAGAQGYLIKPDGIGNLTEEIDRLIQHSRSATT